MRRPTDEGGFGGRGFGAEPISVGRCESDEESAKPQPGQNRPASGTSASQREQRVTFVRKWYLNRARGTPGKRFGDGRNAARYAILRRSGRNAGNALWRRRSGSRSGLTRRSCERPPATALGERVATRSGA